MILTPHPLRRCAVLAACLLFCRAPAAPPPVSPAVENLLGQMTLEEKIGQMTQISSFHDFTGPPPTGRDEQAWLEEIKAGRVGSMFNLTGARAVREAQRLAVEHARLRIPLVFGHDVLHGYYTGFPVPLAESCSWNPDLMERTARAAAAEMAAAGVNWTFAPMVDIGRDPRWGRVVEGAGEDPWLGAVIARARVRGFQGEDLARIDTVAACAKHFAAYGAAEGGRDYNHAEISEWTLRRVYLPPFRAAAEAGAASFMSSFNSILGVPAAGSRRLGDILRDEWGFPGLVVSDWAGVGQMIDHGAVRDGAEAALLAVNAGCDMEMVSTTYAENLAELVRTGKVPLARIDDAVRRILTLKERLGLLADPYRYCDEERERTTVGRAEFRELAREAARESIVLLKNHASLLPLPRGLRHIAVIGPFATDEDSPIGSWRARVPADSAVSLIDGLKEALPQVEFTVHLGCTVVAPGPRDFQDPLRIVHDTSRIDEAVAAAKAAQLVILAVGEDCYLSGEGRSRSDIRLPGAQEALIAAVAKTGKPVVLVLFNGRPLDLSAVVDQADAIVEAWFPGVESGRAIADVLTGRFNPSAKLTMTFPRSVGQVPIYYGAFSTGRPDRSNSLFESQYQDLPSSPLFPFGFGLSYTSYRYSAPVVDRTNLGPGEIARVEVEVTNTGERAGDEIVQLYLRNETGGGVVHPVKELRGFEKVRLAPGETRKVVFRLRPADLEHLSADLRPVLAPGRYVVMTGPSSAETRSASFEIGG